MGAGVHRLLPFFMPAGRRFRIWWAVGGETVLLPFPALERAEKSGKTGRLKPLCPNGFRKCDSARQKISLAICLQIGYNLVTKETTRLQQQRGGSIRHAHAYPVPDALFGDDPSHGELGSGGGGTRRGQLLPGGWQRL